MLGALAWQATTLIKMILVSWGEIARGLFYFSPGFSPCVLVSSCVLPVTTNPSCWHVHRREFILELRTRHQRLSSTMECNSNCMRKNTSCLPSGLTTVLTAEPTTERSSPRTCCSVLNNSAAYGDLQNQFY